MGNIGSLVRRRMPWGESADLGMFRLPASEFKTGPNIEVEEGRADDNPLSLYIALVS
jgi:hypothetical protein